AEREVLQGALDLARPIGSEVTEGVVDGHPRQLDLALGRRDHVDLMTTGAEAGDDGADGLGIGQGLGKEVLGDDQDVHRIAWYRRTNSSLMTGHEKTSLARRACAARSGSRPSSSARRSGLAIRTPGWRSWSRSPNSSSASSTGTPVPAASKIEIEGSRGNTTTSAPRYRSARPRRAS